MTTHFIISSSPSTRTYTHLVLKTERGYDDLPPFRAPEVIFIAEADTPSESKRNAQAWLADYAKNTPGYDLFHAYDVRSLNWCRKTYGGTLANLEDWAAPTASMTIG